MVVFSFVHVWFNFVAFEPHGSVRDGGMCRTVNRECGLQSFHHHFQAWSSYETDDNKHFYLIIVIHPPSMSQGAAITTAIKDAGALSNWC